MGEGYRQWKIKPPQCFGGTIRQEVRGGVENLLLNGVMARQRSSEDWCDGGEVRVCKSLNIWGKIIPSGGRSTWKGCSRSLPRTSRRMVGTRQRCAVRVRRSRKATEDQAVHRHGCPAEDKFSSYNFSVGNNTPCGPQKKHPDRCPKSTLTCFLLSPQTKIAFVTVLSNSEIHTCSSLSLFSHKQFIQNLNLSTWRCSLSF